MTDLEKFNPRGAALKYGADSGDDATNAIACGLVYVGDQVRRANLLAEYEALRDRARDATVVSDSLAARLREVYVLLWPDEADRGPKL